MWRLRELLVRSLQPLIGLPLLAYASQAWRRKEHEVALALVAALLAYWLWDYVLQASDDGHRKSAHPGGGWTESATRVPAIDEPQRPGPLPARNYRRLGMLSPGLRCCRSPVCDAPTAQTSLTCRRCWTRMSRPATRATAAEVAAAASALLLLIYLQTTSRILARSVHAVHWSDQLTSTEVQSTGPVGSCRLCIA